MDVHRATLALLLATACGAEAPTAPQLEPRNEPPAVLPEAPPRPWAIRFVRACSAPWASSEVYATPRHVFACGAIFERETGELLEVRAEAAPLGRLGDATVWRSEDGLVIRSPALERRIPLPSRPERAHPLPDGTLLVQSADHLDVLDPSTGALRRLEGGESCSYSVGPLGVSSRGAVQCLARDRGARRGDGTSLRTVGSAEVAELPLLYGARWVPSGERLLAYGEGAARWIADDGEIVASREVDGDFTFLDVASDGAMLIAREERTERWTFVDGEARVEPVYERAAEAGAFAGDEIVLGSAGSVVWLHRGEPGALPRLAAPATPAGMRALRPGVDGARATFEGDGATYVRGPNDVAAFECDRPCTAHVVVARSDAAELSRFDADDEGWARMVAARFVDPGEQRWAKHWRSDEGRVLRAHWYIGGCMREHVDVLVRERGEVLERWVVQSADGQGLDPILSPIPDDARDARLLGGDAYRGDPSIGLLP